MKTAILWILIFNVVFLLIIVRRSYFAKTCHNKKICRGCGKSFLVTSDYKDDVCPTCIKNNCGIGL